MRRMILSRKSYSPSGSDIGSVPLLRAILGCFFGFSGSAVDVEGRFGDVVVDVVEGGIGRRRGIGEIDATPNPQPRPRNFDVVKFEGKDQGVLLRVRKFWTSHNSGLERCQYRQLTWHGLEYSTMILGHVPKQFVLLLEKVVLVHSRSTSHISVRKN
jgi:hypothetical protein